MPHKYREDVSVTWSIVLKTVENRINTSRKLFESHVFDMVHELSHSSVNRDNSEKSKFFALSWCEQVLKYYDVLCSLRQFLGMKRKTPEQLKIRQCYEFFSQYGNRDNTDVA